MCGPRLYGGCAPAGRPRRGQDPSLRTFEHGCFVGSGLDRSETVRNRAITGRLRAGHARPLPRKQRRRGIAAPPGMDGYGENQALARAAPRAAQAASASPSGEPLAMTGSTTRRAPAASASSAQVRIHSPSPQP